MYLWLFFPQLTVVYAQWTVHSHWTTGVVVELLCSYWTNQKKKDAKMTWKLLTDEKLVSLPFFSFPKPFSHRNEFKSMSIKKRMKGRQHRERQGNRSKGSLLFLLRSNTKISSQTTLPLPVSFLLKKKQKNSYCFIQKQNRNTHKIP